MAAKGSKCVTQDLNLGWFALQAEGEAGKSKGADKVLRKEAGRLTKLQEELERLEARSAAHNDCHATF